MKRNLWQITIRGVVFFSLLFQVVPVLAQSDTLVLTNENKLVGEITAMNRGVLTMETDYSDSDFKIDWEKVKRIETQTHYLITTEKGVHYRGSLSGKAQKNIRIIKNGDTLASVPLNDIVYLKKNNSGFKSNFNASISVGLSLAKAKHFSQLSVRSNFGYRANRWSLEASYNDIRSTQENSSTVRRLKASLSFQYYLNRNWYTVTEVSWLKSTEQNIDLRTLGKLGVGKYLIHSNHAYWGIEAGATFNNENFSVSGKQTTENSAEAFFGTVLNLYDIGDLSLKTGAAVFPSLTESGRWRFNYGIEAQYDLPLDFYISLAFNLNYDNQPVQDSPETDYAFQTTLGWEF